MASITVNPVPYTTNPELWDELLRNDPLQYPLGFPMDQEYSRAYAPDVPYRDLSMIAVVEDQPVAGLQITAHRTGDSAKIDFYGRLALLRLNSNASRAARERAQRALANAFTDLYQGLNTPSFQFLEMSDQGCLSGFAECLLDEGFSASPVYKQVIDLTKGEEELRRAVRKSNKPHINWGEKTLSILIYDHSNITPDTIEQFRQLHITVAGRETRSSESWHVQYREIMEKQAFLITGRLDGQLVTAALFLHSPLYCYYGVSASIREMFDKPLSHAVLWRSILEAKQRGCRLYEMGELVDLYPLGYSDKEKNIADFKRGFGGATHVQLRIGTTGDKPI
jgi:FemAB family protein